jgi:hypothetical protein
MGTLDTNIEIKKNNIEIETFILIGKIKDIELINNLKNLIKKKIKEKNKIEETNIQGLFSGFKSLVNEPYFHIFAEQIKESIKLVCKNNCIIDEAWGNIYYKNNYAQEHHHIGTTAFSGILYLTEGGPGTYFKQYKKNISEEIGKFVLFHSYLLHEVKKIEDEIERMTISFNANIIPKWRVNEFINI